jgi:hypothetical protein
MTHLPVQSAAPATLPAFAVIPPTGLTPHLSPMGTAATPWQTVSSYGCPEAPSELDRPGARLPPLLGRSGELKVRRYGRA